MRRCVQAEAAHEAGIDEVMRGAEVEKRQEAVAVDVDMKVHGVLCLDAGDGVEGDRWLDCRIVRSLRCSSLLLESSHDRHVGRNIIIEEIGRLQVEESLALVTADIGLVTVVTESLTMTLQLLR
jgi:hypothetical protein